MRMQQQCEDPLSYGNITRAINQVTGKDRYKDQIRGSSNIGVGIYLDELPANVRGPTDPPPNEQKGWAAPEIKPWQLSALSPATPVARVPVALLLLVGALPAFLFA